MLSTRYRFYPSGDAQDYLEGPLASFLAALYKNGQIIGDWNLAAIGEHVELSCLIPDTDALDPLRRGPYVQKDLATLVGCSVREPHYEIVGPAVGFSDACTCDDASIYVLYTDFLRLEPPVVCGDCRGYIPLYRLPYPGAEKDYSRILCWEDMYRACDTLYMQSSVGERFGLRQMRDPESQLTKEGLGICRDLSAKLRKPFFYFLWTSPDRPPGKCPSCGSEWCLGEPMADFFTRKCVRCGLVSA